jgi:hypothetical protein
MKIHVGKNITKMELLTGMIQIIVHSGITKNVRSLKLAVNSSVTKNICSRLYARGKNVDTSSSPRHDSPFFMLWTKDDELSLCEELNAVKQ